MSGGAWRAKREWSLSSLSRLSLTPEPTRSFRYEESQEYKSHHDYFDPATDPPDFIQGYLAHKKQLSA